MTARTDNTRGDEDVLLGLLGGEVDAIATDESHDLEIDDWQAQEIRQIVLTTLPQYLLPVEQMAQQLFDSYDDQVKASMLTVVDSVAQAIERIGVVDVAAPLERLRDVLDHLDEQSSRDLDVQQRVLELIADVRRIATGDSTGESTPLVATTLVEAFKGLDGVPAGILEKLTAAGLTTLDQLWMADPGEIMAVSGLDKNVVTGLLDALARQHGRPAKLKTSRQPRSDADRFGSRVDEMIREQVEAEALVDQRRAEVLRARHQLGELRDELAAKQEESAALSRRLAESRERVASGLARVAQLQTEQAAATKRLTAAQAAVNRNETRLEELRRIRESNQRDFDSLASTLALIRERLASLTRDVELTEQGSSSGWTEHGAPD